MSATQLIGSVLRRPSTLDDVAAMVRPDDMPAQRDQLLWRAILDQYERADPIDCISTIHELERQGCLSDVTEDYILEAFASVQHGLNATSYAKIVQDKSIRRSLVETCTEVARIAGEGRETGASLVERVVGEVFRVAERTVQNTLVDVRTSIHEVVDLAMLMCDSGNVIPGISSGIVDLDLKIGGFRKKHMVVVAGRPGSGKTTSVLNWIYFAAFILDQPCLFVSLEMSTIEVMQKILGIASGISSKKISEGRLSDGDKDVMRRHQKVFEAKGSPILIEDNASMTMMHIVALARKAKRTKDIKMVVIDYLQLVNVPDGSRDSRQEQVAKMSRQCKQLAKELDIPVIALSQLNRKVEGRDGHRPVMSDLRETGAIENDADSIMLLYRPEYYDAEDLPGIAEIIVAKNRHGAVGSVFTVFRKAAGRFENLRIMADAVAF